MKKTLSIAILLISLGISAQNLNLSNTSVFEGEPFIAINPTNSKNMVVAWMGFQFGSGSGLTIKIKSTFNSGQTWSSAITLPHMSPNFKSADVSMVFDAAGKLYLSYIDHRQSPDSGGIWFTKSINGGVTWSTPIKVIDMYSDGGKLPIDRPWITVDNTGNNVFITSKPAPWISAPNRPYFSSSNNNGVTWKPWRYIDTTNYLVGSSIQAPMAALAALGNTVIAIYPSYVPTQNIFPQYILAKSLNNGNTFSYTSVITKTNTSIGNDSAKVGYQVIINPNNPSHYVFVFIADLYSSDADVFITESYNSGVTWSAAKRINDDGIANGKMQDLVWANFDTNGDLLITWRDRRNGTGAGYARSSEIYAAFRANGASSFNANFKVSDALVSFSPVLAQDGNDFMSVVIKNDTLNAVWGSTKDGSLDIWYSRMKASTGTFVSIDLLTSESSNITIFPNPSSDIINITVNNNKEIQFIELFDLTGKLVYTQKVNNTHCELNLTNFSSSLYQLRIHQDKLISNKKIHKE